MKTKIKLDLPKAQEIIRKNGLGANGDVQMFHTGNVLRRITKYMPQDTGAMKLGTVISTALNTQAIVTPGPYANYQYRGKLMIDPQINAAGFMTDKGWRSRKGAVKVLTDRDLKISKEVNLQAGPYWDRALVEAEGDVLVEELQTYIDRRK